ncbi:MAG: hypothetical protein ACTSRS_04020 [Candidatus Helarchaeota archaeon]
MVKIDFVLGKISANLWVLPIFGSILISIQALLTFDSLFEALFSLSISLVVTIFTLLSRKNIHGSSFVVLICSYILLLSPLGFSGYSVGALLVLVGALLMISGSIFIISVFFFYVTLGAVLLDIILFCTSLF